MIPKSYEKTHGDVAVNGSGDRGFIIPTRSPIEKDTEARQKPIVIDMTDLNGQSGGKGMPKNWLRKAGRSLPTFTEYMTTEFPSEKNDIE